MSLLLLLFWLWPVQYRGRMLVTTAFAIVLASGPCSRHLGSSSDSLQVYTSLSSVAMLKMAEHLRVPRIPCASAVGLQQIFKAAVTIIREHGWDALHGRDSSGQSLVHRGSRGPEFSTGAQRRSLHSKPCIFKRGSRTLLDGPTLGCGRGEERCLLAAAAA